MKLLCQNGEADFLRQMLLKIAGNAGDCPFLLFLRFHRRRYPPLKQRDLKIVDACAELFIVYGLKNIVRYLKPKRFPAVGKIIVAGYYYKGGIGVLDTAELDNLKTVHNRNIYIHDDNIRAQGINLGQSFHAVAGFAHHFTVMGLPVKELLKALADHDFIIHQKYTQFFHCKSSFIGSNR